MNLKEVAEGLRALADLYEANPLMGKPSVSTIYLHPHGREEVAATIKAFGSFKKRESCEPTDLIIAHQLTPAVEICAFIPREGICERKVVGSKFVEELVIPERVVPAHTEDIVEWECGPMLALTEEQEPTDQVRVSH